MRLLLLLALLAGVVGPAQAPSVAFDWTGDHTGLVTWSGPGLLVVANGGQPYPLSDIVTDDALRVTQLGPGGDVRSVPYPGMLLEVRNLEGTTLAAVVVPEPPPPTIIYLEPPVAVFVGSLYAIEGVRPLWPARLLCAASPCAVPVGAVVSTDGLTGVVVEARRGVALPVVTR